MTNVKIPKLLDTKLTTERNFKTEDTRSTIEKEPMNLAYEALAEATKDIGSNWETVMCFTANDHEPDKVGIQVILCDKNSDIYVDYILYVAEYDHNTLFGTKLVYSKKAWGVIQEPTPVAVHIGRID